MDPITTDRALTAELLENRYAMLSADEFSIDQGIEPDIQSLWDSWENLEPDEYLRGGSRFRLRRFGLFLWLPDSGELSHLSSTEYLQSAELNSYAGGIRRDFAPLQEETSDNRFLHALLKFSFEQFPVNEERLRQPWLIDVHQVRIVATPEEKGEPTPEGVHHDGEEFIGMHLVNLRNASGGVSTVYDNDRLALASCTLRQAMDSMLVWDPYVMHGVTPIQPISSKEAGIRDILVTGFDCRPDLKPPRPRGELN